MQFAHIFVIFSCGWISLSKKSGEKNLRAAGKTSARPTAAHSLSSTVRRKYTTTPEAPPRMQFEESVFRKHIQSGTTYIDKTEFIVELLARHHECVSISRPKGFGKSLNLDMLREFLRIDRNSSESVFKDGMTIMKDQYKAIRDEYMNESPVVFFSFKRVGECKNFEDAESELRLVMLRVFNEYKYLLKSTKISSEYKNILQDVIERNKFETNDFHALPKLSTMLTCHHGRRSFLIIDDFDSPIMGAMVYGYHDQMRWLMYNTVVRQVLNCRYVHKVIVASGMPMNDLVPDRKFLDLRSYTIYDDYFFATCFGFTENDVKKLLKKSGKENDAILMKSITQWYNQFSIGKERIYNPYSVLKCYEANWDIKAYATASCSLSKLTQHLITDMGLLPSLNFQILMTNVSLEKRVFCYFPGFKNILTYEHYLWTYFTHAGIIVSEEKPSWEIKRPLPIRITHGRDIRNMLQNDVIEPLVKCKKIPDYSQFTEHVQKGNAEKVRKIMEKYILGGGVYLFLRSRYVDRNRKIADYVILIMSQWTTNYGGRVMTDENGDQLILKFYGRDKKEMVRVQIRTSSETTGIWRTIKDCVLSSMIVTEWAGPKINVAITLCDKYWRDQCPKT